MASQFLFYREFSALPAQCMARAMHGIAAVPMVGMASADLAGARNRFDAVNERWLALPPYQKRG
jgi:hypothetical protein